MRTFVLSGGGNRGPLQAGAIKALLAAGVAPQMIVGSSAGALNGAYLAVEPTLEQAERMAQLWRDAGKHKLFVSSPVRSIVNAVRGKDHLVDNKRIRAYIHESVPEHVRTFADLSVPLYVTICHLLTQSLYIYGDDLGAPLIDAVLTSAAVPGFFPPAYHNGQAFVDGGVMSNLPLQVAIARGATEIWAIDIAFDVAADASLKGAFEIAGYSIRRPLYEATLRELELATQTPGVKVHHVPLYGFQNVRLGDFSKTDAMIDEGERAMRSYLAHPQPNHIHYPRHYDAHDLPPGPPGSRPFVERQPDQLGYPISDDHHSANGNGKAQQLTPVREQLSLRSSSRLNLRSGFRTISRSS